MIGRRLTPLRSVRDRHHACGSFEHRGGAHGARRASGQLTVDIDLADGHQPYSACYQSRASAWTSLSISLLSMTIESTERRETPAYQGLAGSMVVNFSPCGAMKNTSSLAGSVALALRDTMCR